jgi:predicted small metal-binding protein
VSLGDVIQARDEWRAVRQQLAEVRRRLVEHHNEGRKERKISA